MIQGSIIIIIIILLSNIPFGIFILAQYIHYTSHIHYSRVVNEKFRKVGHCPVTVLPPGESSQHEKPSQMRGQNLTSGSRPGIRRCLVQHSAAAWQHCVHWSQRSWFGSVPQTARTAGALPTSG